MHRHLSLPLLLLACCLALPVGALEVGDMAPDFELPATNGKQYRLSELRGESAVVLAWFPRAFTSGCTIECRSITRSGDKLQQFDVHYFMISVDPIERNTRFAESLLANFPLLSDASKEVARDYGVLYDDRFALRHTFYINREGRIEAIDRNVNPETSAADMIEQLEAMGVPRGGAD
jgi:peroxiredoxin Q/BCP